MSFDLDQRKKVQKVIASRKIIKQTHPTLTFNKSSVTINIPTPSCYFKLL